ncbi:hypothetical protein BM1_11001 [Bipolaris maydis]|nr:hypothetical protein BM1_11001 [Bipolaris maydis]
MVPTILSILSWRDGCDGAAILSCTAILDGQPWRDGILRGLEPCDSHPVYWDPEWLPNYSSLYLGRGFFLLLLVIKTMIWKRRRRRRGRIDYYEE